jgi:hypothetical protein
MDTDNSIALCHASKSLKDFTKKLPLPNG